MSIAITSVRSHVGVSETEFTDLTASSLSNPGIFTVGQGGGTVVPTVPVGTTGTIAPTLTAHRDRDTVAPTLTVEPVTVTGNVTDTITQPTTITTGTSDRDHDRRPVRSRAGLERRQRGLHRRRR